MKTRLRSLLWVFMALTLLLAGTTLVRAYDISFSDVPESSWFYEDVMTLSESGVVSGYPDGTYRPTKKVTTGESLKMILLAAGYPEPERAESHWARGYLNFAIDQGFLVRYQDTVSYTHLDVYKRQVRNVIDFGVFVDIGVHQDGLVHISQVSNKFIKHPSEVVRCV